MFFVNKKSLFSFIGLLGLVAAAQGARADVIQTLDSVDAITNKAVLEMHVDSNAPDDCAPDDYACINTSLPSGGTLLPGIPATATFAACQRAADRQMYCLLNSFPSGNTIRQPVSRWSETGSYEAMFDCTDPKLGLDTKKANPCTTISATLGGDVWLGGREGSAYSIIKVVEVGQGAQCPMGFNGVRMQKLTAETNANHDYCMLRYVSGRPVLIDVSSVDARVGKRFEAPGISPGAGLLLLEDRKTVAFLPDRVDGSGNPVLSPAVDITSGKSVWGLSGGDTIQSASLMQVNCSATNCDNFLLVTTGTGKLLAKQIDVSTTSGLTLGATANPVSNAACSTGQAWVRVSPQSGRIYFSDRCANRVRGFEVPLSGYTSTSTWTQVASLSTLNPDLSANPPNTLSVSPGIPINLAKCFDEQCVLAADGADTNSVGAYITNVTIELLTGKTGMTVFKVQGIPDCRYSSPAICLGPNGDDPNYAIETIGGEQYLRVDRLLPLEVMELFDENTTPTRADLALRIGPQYRARPDRGNTFDAFFGRTEDGVQFRETFDVDFDIRELIGDVSGTPTRCGYLNDGIGANTRSPDNWDVIATVSERVVVAGTNNGTAEAPSGTLLHRDMLVNTFCENPTSGSGTRWSLYAYGLMQATCVTGNTITPGTYQCQTSFVDLTSKLFDDLERARVMTACTNVDGNPNGLPPLGATTCANLASTWANARDKLNKCLEATQQPKNSSLNQNCQAFDSQFTQYQNVLNGAVVNGVVVNGLQTGDVANRLGELKARVRVFLHVYGDQMLPSVPPGGFPLP